ncbi:MAG: DUF2523 family protein [Opitutus sp.]
MPFLIAALLDALEWLFATRLGLWVVSAFAFLGISFGTQKFVVQPLLDELQTLAGGVSSSSDFGSMALSWLGLLNFDKALAMIISAVATKYAVSATRLFLQKKAA